MKNRHATGEPMQTQARLSATHLEPRWYAACTRSRHEKSVAEQLARKSVEAFVPLYETVRRWKNGQHRVQLPLFSGYAFARIALRDRLEVLKVPGVVRLVGFERVPAPLPDEDIERLRRALTSGTKAEPHPFLTAGRRVRITAGPLAGNEGVLVRRRGIVRVVLSIEVIQRSILVEVEANWLEPVWGSRSVVRRNPDTNVVKDFRAQDLICN
ncbi:MAG: UpxY family transcription antiterminator [Candidatus Acidiferrales bacterium]